MELGEDQEVLAQALGHDSTRTGAALLARFDSVLGLLRASPEALAHEKLPREQARRLLAALELGRRGGALRLQREEPLANARAVALLVGPRLLDGRREELHVIGVDSRLVVTTRFVAAVGGLAEVAVRPRDVFRPLVRDEAWGCVVVHNHPSGDPTPSAADRTLTRRLRQAADLLGLNL